MTGTACRESRMEREETHSVSVGFHFERNWAEIIVGLLFFGPFVFISPLVFLDGIIKLGLIHFFRSLQTCSFDSA